MSYYGDILKKESEALDRKEKDFAPYSFKLNAEPKDGLKLSHTHKEGGDKTISTSKIELPEMPLPMVDGLKMSYEFDREKFTKTMNYDVYKADGNKVNAAIKYTWTPGKELHAVNICKKIQSQDLGGFNANVQTDLDLTKNAKDKAGNNDDVVGMKGSVVAQAADWAFGVNGEMQKSKKLGMKATYKVSEDVLAFMKGDAEFPQSKHNSLAAGASMNSHGWNHIYQVLVNLPNEALGDGKAFSGFMGQPVELSAGHTTKVGATEFQASVKYSKDIEVHNAVTHKVNDNLSAKMHQHFFSERIGGEKNPVDVGFELSYKL